LVVFLKSKLKKIFLIMILKNIKNYVRYDFCMENKKK
jgi:hypothetical protein